MIHIKKKEQNLVGRGIDYNHLRFNSVLCNQLIVIILQLLVEIQKILSFIADRGSFFETCDGV